MKEEQETPHVHHVLIPLHEKLTDKERKELLARYNVTFRELPKIIIGDAALTGMDVAVGDVIRITRVSPTAGKTYFYRGVSSD